MRSVARSKGELGAVGRVGLVAAMFAVVVGCASQPVAPLRGPLPRGAVRLVSHLESPLRIRTLGVAVDGGLSVFHYNDSSAPLPAYIILPRPHVPGVHFLQVHVEVAHPCFPAGDLHRRRASGVECCLRTQLHRRGSSSFTARALARRAPASTFASSVPYGRRTSHITIHQRLNSPPPSRRRAACGTSCECLTSGSTWRALTAMALTVAF